LDKAKDSPETMCIVGNCYSLQKEHETALKYFTQAIKIDPNLAYAHALSGHEYVANEDYEKAKRCF
jgi:anaphase-promoting complex subunit 3